MRYDPRPVFCTSSILRAMPLLAALAWGCGDDDPAEADTDASTAGSSAGSHAGDTAGMPAAGTSAGGSRASGGRSGAAGSGGRSAGSGGGGSGGSSGSSGGSGGTGSAMSGKSPGCGTDPPAAGEATIEVNAMERQYLLSLPTNYDKNRAYPIIMAFHGSSLTGPRLRSFFNLVTPAGPDAIVVYPTALGNPTGWNAQRDIPFIDALRMKLESSLCIDTARVFATGHSSGAFFTNALGCQRGDRMRAIAPMSGGPQGSSCKGELAVWISHGNADDVVATSSGRQTRDFWTKRNKCDVTMSTPVSPSPCVEYDNCDEGFPVRYCEYDGDHDLMPNAAQTIWAFFKQF